MTAHNNDIVGYVEESTYGTEPIEWEPQGFPATQKITIPELDASSMKALRESFEGMMSNTFVIPMMPIEQYECCRFCEEHDKLPEAIQKKILLLMKLAGAEIA